MMVCIHVVSLRIGQPLENAGKSAFEVSEVVGQLALFPRDIKRVYSFVRQWQLHPLVH